jgi:hypothetical protein
MFGIQFKPDMIYDGTRFHIVFSDNGADAVQYLTVDLPMSVPASAMLDFQMNISPNPANDFLNVILKDHRNGEKYVAGITDSMGNLIRVLPFASDGKLLMDTRELVGGTYSICITNDQSEIAIKKFVVLH